VKPVKPQIDVHYSNLRPPRLERIVRIPGHDQVANFRGEKPRELGHSPELRHLLGNACLKRSIPIGKLRCLLLDLPALDPNLVEESDVLQSNGRLICVCHGLPNLPLGKRAYLHPSDQNRSDSDIVP
jgi:hypothetical protein